MASIILYTTAGCHLCEEAEELLRQSQAGSPLTWQAVDIADQPELMERYGIRIPVLQKTDGGAELGWPFDLEQLRLFLAGNTVASDDLF